MKGQNKVWTEEWDFSAVRFVCALNSMLCDSMEGCTNSLNIVQQVAAQWTLQTVWWAMNSMLGLTSEPGAKTFCDEMSSHGFSEHTYKQADEVLKVPCL